MKRLLSVLLFGFCVAASAAPTPPVQPNPVTTNKVANGSSGDVLTWTAGKPAFSAPVAGGSGIASNSGTGILNKFTNSTLAGTTLTAPATNAQIVARDTTFKLMLSDGVVGMSMSVSTATPEFANGLTSGGASKSQVNPDGTAVFSGLGTFGSLKSLGDNTLSNGTTRIGVIQGVTDASSAPAGSWGEVVSSLVANTAAKVMVGTPVVTNITSISLTAGDWDVEGNVNMAGATATITQAEAGISTTSIVLPTDGSEVYSDVPVTLFSGTNSIVLPRKRINVSSTTTVYLVGSCTFSAGAVTAFGGITARRMR